MREKECPDWWPPFEPNDYPPFTFHSQVFEAGIEAGVKAVMARIDVLMEQMIRVVEATPVTGLEALALVDIGLKGLKDEAGLE